MPVSTDSSSTVVDTSDSQVDIKAGGRPPPNPPSGKGKEGEERKLVPPPPIIGPDGKELPRPKDAAGRPLPIYVTADGKPVLGKDGLPIPLRFDDKGKPIPLNPDGAKRKSSGEKRDSGDTERPVVVRQETTKESKLPNFLIYIGAADIIVGLIIGVYYAYTAATYEHDSKAKQDNSNASVDDIKRFLAAIAALLFVGASFGTLPIFAVKKTKSSLLWIWSVLNVILLVITTGIGYKIIGHVIAALAYLGIRLFVSLFILCAVCDPPADYTSNPRYVASSGGSRPAYVRGGAAAPQTVIVQQPAYVPAYGAYGGYGGYYPGYSYGDAALLGFAAGSMLGHSHYGYYDDWGWGGGWGYDGGWGGYDGFYDGW